MNPTKFDAMLVLLVPSVIKEIVSNNNISELDATVAFYSSQLYEDLEREDTKLWHLSAKALYQLEEEETKTGKISYPEEV